MLFPALFAQTPPDNLAWTGAVKAFDYYASPACRDEDRVATVYIARKLFEDGSTVTVVRNVPRDGLAHLRASMRGEGRVERDPTGAVTRLDSYAELRPHGGSYSYYEPIFGKNSVGAQWGHTERAPSLSPVTLDERRLSLDPKTGLLGGSWTRDVITRGIVFSGPRTFWLDRLEAVAFGGPPSLSPGWRFATGVDDGGKVVRSAGTTALLNDRGNYPVEIAGQRVALRRIDLVILNPFNGQPPPAPMADTLLLRPDGGVAAYVPGPTMAVGPSLVGWDGYVSGNNLPPDPTPPFALKGKLKEAWDRGLDPQLDRLGQGGIFLPVPVSAGTFQNLMETIGERERPAPPTTKDAPPDGR